MAAAAPATLEGVPAAGGIDDNAPHRLGRGTEEVAGRVPPFPPHPHEDPHHRLVGQRRRVERVGGPLIGELARGKGPDFGVERTDERPGLKRPPRRAAVEIFDRLPPGRPDQTGHARLWTCHPGGVLEPENSLVSRGKAAGLDCHDRLERLCHRPTLPRRLTGDDRHHTPPTSEIHSDGGMSRRSRLPPPARRPRRPFF